MNGTRFCIPSTLSKYRIEYRIICLKYDTIAKQVFYYPTLYYSLILIHERGMRISRSFSVNRNLCSQKFSQVNAQQRYFKS